MTQGQARFAQNVVKISGTTPRMIAIGFEAGRFYLRPRTYRGAYSKRRDPPKWTARYHGAGITSRPRCSGGYRGADCRNRAQQKNHLISTKANPTACRSEFKGPILGGALFMRHQCSQPFRKGGGMASHPSTKKSRRLWQISTTNFFGRCPRGLFGTKSPLGGSMNLVEMALAGAAAPKKLREWHFSSKVPSEDRSTGIKPKQRLWAQFVVFRRQFF